MGVVRAKTIPILPSSDLDGTTSFYSTLGFTEESRFPGEYLILNHPIGIELHFWLASHLDKATNYASCYVRFDSANQAQSLYDDWANSGLDSESLRAPEDPGYNLLEFAVLDLDRNLVRIGGIIESPDR